MSTEGLRKAGNIEKKVEKYWNTMTLWVTGRCQSREKTYIEWGMHIYMRCVSHYDALTRESMDKSKHGITDAFWVTIPQCIRMTRLLPSTR